MIVITYPEYVDVGYLLLSILSNASAPAAPGSSVGASLLNSLPEWLTAAGTIGATLVALGFLRRKPRLRIEIQRQEGNQGAYWHATSDVYAGITVKQSRIWLQNAGGREARNCRVKLTIEEARLAGGDAPLEFLLPATNLYTPEMDRVALARIGVPNPLRPPNDSEVSITISPRSREAFDLVYHFERVEQSINPYSKTTFPLLPNVEYILNLTAYADEIKPSRAFRFRLLWNGNEEGLGGAITQLPAS